MRHLFIAIFCFSAAFVSAQINSLVGYYPFDDCKIEDKSGNKLNPLITGNPTCVCGVLGSAVHFDPASDALAFPLTLSNYLGVGSFTLAFYFRADKSSPDQLIFSKREDCSPNHAFAIEYLAAGNQLKITMSEDGTNQSNFNYNLPPGRCWYHIALSRSGTKTRLYVDGKQVYSADAPKTLSLVSADSLHIGSSPCIGAQITPFAGDIDEMYLFRSALTDANIADLYQESDKILSNDKFVYLGKSTQIDVLPSCAQSFSWSPSQGVATPDSANTLITPEQSTTYTLQFSYTGCTATDTIRLRVVDPATIDCDQLMLPSAFTPNGDQLNDTYRISNADIIKELIGFEIFDRWGNQVFQAMDINTTWDGNFKGQPVNPGTYMYKVRFKCGNVELVKSGSVQVIR
ncbi:MAG: LamG-like jellyroll fold domain-containing protein [Saprospiraceae bacterium]